MKKLIFGLVFMTLLSVTVNAQSRWNNFLDPKVTPEMLKITTGTKAGGHFEFLPRPAVLYTGRVIKPFMPDSLEITGFNRLGMGLGINHYKVREDGTIYINYGFSAALCVKTATNPNMGILATGSVLDIWNLAFTVGVGLDFIEKEPSMTTWNNVKRNFMVVYGIKLNY